MSSNRPAAPTGLEDKHFGYTHEAEDKDAKDVDEEEYEAQVASGNERRLICPLETCHDSIPFPLPTGIKNLLSRYHLNDDSSEDSPSDEVTTSYERLNAQISLCKAINLVHTEKAALRYFNMHGLPTKIDFVALPIRILEFQDAIQERATNRERLTDCFIWKSLLNHTSKKGLTLSGIARCGMAQLPSSIISLARPGYYGNKGAHIIEAVVLKLVDPMSDAFAPLSLQAFRALYLIPYVATRLIAQDKHCSITEAWDLLISSAGYGSILQRIEDEDEDELDDIVRSVYLNPTSYMRCTGPRPKPRPLRKKETPAAEPGDLDTGPCRTSARCHPPLREPLELPQKRYHLRSHTKQVLTTVTTDDASS
ncbi:hypothetical protein PC9H_008981 [Pleurotus ostreatus]|uniref:Restriction of telomere capping protein 4 C-terminal domain-containing protein n=1 Tax=Pleurotus ostreatus TaxID=5322 RepID=A0A8H6ZSU4_PLEOS|nr:uncharacterized protein PC9H_008981 [Pleurotus ostreatus]KAF7426612.1 hypothetical protein PC9H_008981 [Pleurotus ostreatus]